MAMMYLMITASYKHTHFSDSLETAIRKAGDAEYTSNDEEKGRGKRKKKFRQPSTSPSTDDREGGYKSMFQEDSVDSLEFFLTFVDSISPPPKLDIEQAEIIWEQPCEELSEALNLDVDINSGNNLTQNMLCRTLNNLCLFIVVTPFAKGEDVISEVFQSSEYSVTSESHTPSSGIHILEQLANWVLFCHMINMLFSFHCRIRQGEH
ncbi:uncharacterized protein LOC123321872 [Coccinella septempunctata]|uniref:uncharacterized protein LOC123321872 n=1 Tax=Coccinella septempunctata TaxID=41139 RepID=UPI001D06B25F|nr:uncharacterized protein LOC123321872 [Coccinella septempunctata]